jgi:hypothetical protein
MTQTGRLLVIDPVTDATETATSVVVRNLETGDEATITDSAQIRALYHNPTAQSYGEGSYTVEMQ